MERLAEADELRENLVRSLITDRALCTERWQAAFRAVPRHVFLPRFFQHDDEGGWSAVDSNDPEWLEAVYSDRVLVTQLDGDPTRWETARRARRVEGKPTCSSSMPMIMAIMLEALRVRDGQRLLEIGTGTGYNAALCCYALGDSLVSTVDIDEDLVRTAREHLATCGFEPRSTIADGVYGYPAGAPYDRLLCTCAVSEIPLSWLEQTRPGGLVVTTLNRPIGAGLVRIEALGGPHGVGRVLATDGRFMPLRAHQLDDPVSLLANADPGSRFVSTRSSTLPVSAMLDPCSPFEFFSGLALPDVQAVSENDHAVLVHPDGSWASHRSRRGRSMIAQGGPRRLWDEAENAFEQWRLLEEPTRDRFGITVGPQAQEFWLDYPDSEYRWSLRPGPG
ncbi:MAG: protein-L-isoaspartate O-methyltransferase [Pseudonocardiaceae bacterium]|nr:protein-L-isoaspartate O-methyltransferase [Pseudonocardiaceae bacterium]